LCRQKKYGEAARIKAVADELERRERAKLDEERLSSFAQKEAKFRTQHAAELQALLKRIETRRAEHVKQRDLDSKRLVQRNKNVMAVLEQRQLAEEAKKVAEIRAQLAPPRSAYQRLQPLDTGNARHKMDMLRGGKGGSPQGGVRSDSPAQGVEEEEGLGGGGGGGHYAGAGSSPASSSPVTSFAAAKAASAMNLGTGGFTGGGVPSSASSASSLGRPAGLGSPVGLMAARSPGGARAMVMRQAGGGGGGSGGGGAGGSAGSGGYGAGSVGGGGGRDSVSSGGRGGAAVVSPYAR
jgi:hypothetical protein